MELTDRFRDFLGAEVLEVRKGYAKVKGVVKEDFLNPHGTAHGAYIIALADFAFGLAVNYDEPRIAININVNFYKPAFLGDELIAEAEVKGGRRVCFCVLRVYRNEELIAEGTSIAYSIKKS